MSLHLTSRTLSPSSKAEFQVWRQLDLCLFPKGRSPEDEPGLVRDT